MTVEESIEVCRTIFRGQKAASRVFYAVNQKYNVLLRLPTEEDLRDGLPTQEAQRAKVKPTHAVVVRADESGNPVLIDTPDGRKVQDQWATGQDKLKENFDFEGELQPGEVKRGTRNPGKRCAYVRLSETLTLTWRRGVEVWVAGSYMSCYDEEKMESFTSITAVSFDAMKEPADAESAELLKRLKSEAIA